MHSLQLQLFIWSFSISFSMFICIIKNFPFQLNCYGDSIFNSLIKFRTVQIVTCLVKITGCSLFTFESYICTVPAYPCFSFSWNEWIFSLVYVWNLFVVSQFCMTVVLVVWPSLSLSFSLSLPMLWGQTVLYICKNFCSPCVCVWVIKIITCAAYNTQSHLEWNCVWCTMYITLYTTAPC